MEEDVKIIVEETDDILSEQRQPTPIGIEGSDDSSHSDRELNWNFEDVTGLPVDDG